MRFQRGAALHRRPRGGVSRPAAAAFTYGADHAPNDELIEFARDTDLLLIEATLPAARARGPARAHDAAEAGEHGRRAQARRLVITHISDELDAGWARAEAERGFGGAGRGRPPGRGVRRLRLTSRPNRPITKAEDPRDDPWPETARKA